MQPLNKVIEMKNVYKSYSGIMKLENISLTIEKGKTIGLIGSNGSGKSLLFRIMCGLVKADSGYLKINEKDLGTEYDFPPDFGILINGPGYFGGYTGFDNLKYLAGIQNRINSEDIRNTMIEVGLNPDDSTKVKNYSMGMKQKLGIAQAIMEDQQTLLLDEPFNGLDINTYKEIKEIIKMLKKQGKTILLTSHNFNDIEELCDEIYMISDKKLSPISDEAMKYYSGR